MADELTMRPAVTVRNPSALIHVFAFAAAAREQAEQGSVIAAPE